MAVGLRTYDASGNILVDLTDRLGRYVSSHTVSPPTAWNGVTTVYISGYTPGSWHFVVSKRLQFVKVEELSGAVRFTCKYTSGCNGTSFTMHVFRW